MSYHLRLTRGMSYSNGKLKATQQHPDVLVEDRATADEAVASGFFSVVEAEDTAEPETGVDEAKVDYEALAAMTKASLTSYAEKHGIDISECKTKADILEAISVANGGSYTMLDLQRMQGGEQDGGETVGNT